ncbi:MAG: transposase [Pseudomonadales bacterium]
MLDWLANGLVAHTVGELVIYTLVVTHITIVSVTVYLHRHSAHRSLDLHPVLAHFFRFWLWLTTGMGTLQWTAIHRKHHAVCETPDDPHSPQVMGLRRILLQGVEVYREGGTPETLARFGAGCPNDWVERHVYTPHSSLGIFLMLAINIGVFGVIGLSIWAVQMLWIPLFAAGVINGIGHFWGYRNFECNDASRNISPWGILIGGEELHNNHHTYPNAAKLSVKPWEFDIGWFWIRLFSMLGLARVKSRGPIAVKVEGKSSLDLDTAWAILNDRFRVMARYAEYVIAPSVRAELGKTMAPSRRLVRQARQALSRDSGILTARQQARIDNLVSRSDELKRVYELRLALLDVWRKRTNAEELLAGLRHWCQEAEASGLRVLEDFVAELKRYAMPAPRLA